MLQRTDRNTMAEALRYAGERIPMRWRHDQGAPVQAFESNRGRRHMIVEVIACAVGRVEMGGRRLSNATEDGRGSDGRGAAGR
jgi:hypothetical protein